MGDTSGEEGMLSHMAPLGLRREGVRAAGDRSSDRDATRSRERRAVHVVEPLLLLRGGGEEDGTARLALLAAAAVDAATLRSVCLLFWNQIVTDFISIDPAFATASRSSREGCEFWWKRFSSITSWAWVNRFRVLRVAVTVLLLIVSSAESMLVVEDVRDSDGWVACMGGKRGRGERGEIGRAHV